MDRDPPIKYKIRYPGWDVRWDEWVDRKRLRWAVETDLISKIQVHDPVELWCCGNNVPGAWLESVVMRINKGKYGVLRAQSLGIVWVPRHRLRPLNNFKRGLPKGQEQLNKTLINVCAPSCNIM